jgi:orotate phosphoribosyltransferase
VSGENVGFDRSAAASRTAEALLSHGAVHFYADNPFIFTSGWASPVYIDCRHLISFPVARRQLVADATALIRAEVGADRLDSVAGAETAGIPFAAWISEELDLPMQYVRKQPKGFARNAQIEGHLEPGQRALLVDDIATDGRSKFKFAAAMREAGLQVEDVATIFWYGIFPDSEQSFRDHGLTLHSLASWADVLAAAQAASVVDGETLAELERFLDDPIGWSRAHGGVGEQKPIAQPYAGDPQR